MKQSPLPKALGFLFFVLGIMYFAVAAEDPLASIKKFYADTSAAIELGRKGEGGGLYSTEILINSHNLSWRAVGNYSKKVVFWYTDQPEFASYENKPETSVLAKVEVKTTAAVRSEYEEFFFQDGALVFTYRQSRAGEEPPSEMRYYFQNNALLKLVTGNTAATEKPDISPILKTAASYQQLFLATFR
jgi:hypothetical protein